MKKEDQQNVKLSYESDGKMGKENKNDENSSGDKAENEFFNITQGSE